MPTAFTLTSASDGTALRGWSWPAERRAPRANLVLAHGAGEHARRYDAFAEALARRDVAVWALDHRGHGESARPDALGDFGAGGWAGLVADLEQLAGHAGDEYPGAPTLLFGHSMGSLAAQQIMVDRSRTLEGVVLSGTTCFDVLAESAAAGGLASFNAPFEAAGEGRTGFEWLSRDPERVDAYVADPLCGFDPAPAAVEGMFAAAARLAEPETLRRIRSDLPVLLVAGDADPLNANWTLIETLVARLHDAGLTDVEVQRHVGGRHEPLNEIDRAEVVGELLDWIERVITR
ncbi:MAG: alpha/beta fold hydrolase [Pseudomonadales bacterium]|jgi:alpha-beta hydrolase superfamily lysophospholipase|nr:alpha/beta fold hydrolase [Pseudomonadales bacterium]